MKKIISLILVILMLTMVLASCGGGANGGSNDDYKNSIRNPIKNTFESTQKTTTAKTTTTQPITSNVTTTNKPVEPPEDLSVIRFTNDAFVSYFDSMTDKSFIDEQSLNALEFIFTTGNILNGFHTVSELHGLITEIYPENSDFTLFQLQQFYGLYLWNEFDNDAVAFEEILNYMVSISDTEEGKCFIDEQTKKDLSDLLLGLGAFKNKMNALVNKNEFLEFGCENFGDAGWVNMACSGLFNLVQKDSDGRAKIVDILRLTSKVSYMLPQEYSAMIENYIYVYDVIDKECPYDEFLPLLQKVILALTNENYTISATDSDVQQIYIMYFYHRNDVPDVSIDGREFCDFVSASILTNASIAKIIQNDAVIKIEDASLVDEFLSNPDERDLNEMHAEINELLGNLKRNLNLKSVSIDAITEIYRDCYRNQE